MVAKSDQESLVSTNESVNQAGIDPLEPIIEEGSETDTSSEHSIYIMANQHAEANQTNMAAEGATSQSMYVDRRYTTIYLEGANNHGALVYADVRGRRCICIEEKPARGIEIVQVYDDGDRFRDDEGVHYLIVRDPENYNHYGDNMAKGKMVMETVEIPPQTRTPRSSMYL